MKLFDYKFLIIFALSFVVYFIYKEMEYLRCKILSIEKKMLTEQVNNLKEPDALFKEAPKKINVDLSYNTVVSESETSISSRHVAIYSNDNLEHEEEEELKSEEKEEIKSEEKEELKCEEKKEEKCEHTKESLSKLTLDGLKTIAKDKNISLTKENGKHKIKKELIDNILE
jgi:hypothetical protein